MTELLVPRDTWIDIQALLSLDLIAPFAPSLGVLRGLDLICDSLRRTTPVGKTWFDIDDEALGALQNETLSRIARAGDGKDATAFLVWTREAYTGGGQDQPVWSAWSVALRAWAHRSAPLGEAEPFRARAKLVVETADAHRFWGRDFGAEVGRLSDWDLDMFVARGWAASVDHPQTTIGFMASTFAMRRAWAVHAADLAPGHARLLEQSAQAVLDADGIGEWYTATFPPPVEPSTCL